MHKIKIEDLLVLVEDNPADVAYLEAVFEEVKLLNPLKVVSDGERALAYLRKEDPYAEAASPGLVLLDLHMPRMDGFQVLDELRSDPVMEMIPVVMLSSVVDDQEVIKAYQKGARAYLHKPFDAKALIDVLGKFYLGWSLVMKVPEPPGISGSQARDA